MSKEVTLRDLHGLRAFCAALESHADTITLQAENVRGHAQVMQSRLDALVEQVTADAREVMCSRCGRGTGWAWVGGVPPLEMLCASCIADKQADRLTMHDGDTFPVDNGMKNITVELVECPRCGCKLADPGAEYCDGCAEGL